MLLRILLIVAILAGIGVIAVGHFQLRPHIQGIIDERDKNAKDRDTERSLKQKAQTELKKTQGDLADTKKELGDTKKQLETAKNEASSQQKRADELSKDLDTNKGKLRDAEQKLDAWKNLGKSVEQVIAIIESEKKLRVDLEALILEKQILEKQLRQALAELDKYRSAGTNYVLLAPYVKGRVLVVDPKWKFVVLDIGSKDDVKLKGVLLVSREGKLVSMVSVSSVQADRSIANIVPGWNFGDIMEGDVVISSTELPSAVGLKL